MNHHASIIWLLFVVACSGSIERLLPTDAQAFVEQRDLCDHFRGEAPYDEQRQQFLEQNIAALCTGSDARLAALKHKHLDHEAVQAVLLEYEVDIEPRSEEHTSELQSLMRISYAVFCLKKKKDTFTQKRIAWYSN